MKNTIEYKGYVGTVEFSESDEVFFGKVLGIEALISYEGTDAHSLIIDFHNSVDDYLMLCEQEHKKPEVPYKGSFNVRISPEIHKRAAVYAINHQMSLNSFVAETLRERLTAINA